MSRCPAPGNLADPRRRTPPRGVRGGPAGSRAAGLAAGRVLRERTTPPRRRFPREPGALWRDVRCAPGRRCPRRRSPRSREPVVGIAELGLADPDRVTLAAPCGGEGGVDAGGTQLALQTGDRLVVLEVDSTNHPLHELADHPEPAVLADHVGGDHAPGPGVVHAM